MKGFALAHTVYPNPRCRPMSDLDLWVEVGQREAAVATLEALGYRSHAKSTRPPALMWLYDGEQQLQGPPPAGLAVEIQWPAIRGEWVRAITRIDHAGIWRRRQQVTIDGRPAAIMAPEDLILHLAIHQAINHQFTFPCWLRSLLDVHLVVQGGSVDWSALVQRARQWKTATVAWVVLSLTADLLGSAIPQEVLQALAPGAPQRALIRRLQLDRSIIEMWPSQHDHRRLLVQSLLVDGPAPLTRLLWRSLFPDAAWLQARYHMQEDDSLWRLRAQHLWQLIVRAQP